MSEPWALTPKQAAELLNLSVRSLYELIRTGQIPSIELKVYRATRTGRIRIRRDDLAAWLASQPIATPRPEADEDEDLDLETLDEVVRARGTH